MDELEKTTTKESLRAGVEICNLSSVPSIQMSHRAISITSVFNARDAPGNHFGMHKEEEQRAPRLILICPSAEREFVLVSPVVAF